MQGANMVSWRDYEGIDGFGVASVEEMNDLRKALVAGDSINPPAVAPGEGFPLRVESLERVLRTTTYKMKDIKLWKNLVKLPAYNTVEEYNLIQEYGQVGIPGFITEGALPEETDATYERKFAQMKFLGTTRKVSHVMTLVRPAHGSVTAQETVNGTMYLLRVVEKALFEADTANTAIQFDGFNKLITSGAPATNIIDLRGAPLSEDILQDGALTVSDQPNYGYPTDLYLNPKVKSDLTKTFFPRGRYDIPATGNNYVGLTIDGFTSEAGDIRFQPDTFIDDGGPKGAASGDPSKRPADPAISTAAATFNDPANSEFIATDAGSYRYSVVAVNDSGRSAPVDLGPVAVIADDRVDVGVTPGSAIAVTHYELFRTKVGGAAGTERLIIRFPSVGPGETTIQDFNNFLPGTTSAYMFQQDTENMSAKQLAPMIKVPLATIDSSVRWMQLIYIVPILYTPGKNVLFVNVGRSPNFVGGP